MKRTRKLLRVHPADIQAAIKKAGYTHKTLAQRINLRDATASMVSHVIHGRYRSRQVESLISEVTGIPLQRLWPKWYPSVRKGRAA